MRQVSIHRTVSDRLRIDIDHESARLAAGEILGSGNVYSLIWQGWEGEALQELSLGNLSRSIPGSRYLPLDAGGVESFALRGEARLGPVDLDAILRYGGELEGRRRFRGSRLAVQVDLKDVDYLRGRFFLLPDVGIDEVGLRVAKSSPTGPILIDGRPYALLSRGVDWRLDNSAGRLTLTRPLAQSEELAVAYTKSGISVGEPGLGGLAIIDSLGARVDFSSTAFPEYFGSDGTTDWLFLHRQALNSYWEIRGVFALEDLDDGQVPEGLSIEALHTTTLAPNSAYDSIAGAFRVDPAGGTLSFEPADAASRYYPRPFPGEEPYGTLPITAANNPFDPDNPIYGGPSYAPANASITTLRIRYMVSTDTWFLDPNVVAGSVRVTVDGVALASSAWTVDPVAGTISFDPGTIGPESDVEVVYRWAPFAGAGRTIMAALGAGIGDESLGARNLITLQLPIPDAPAPRLGEEQPARVADSVDAVATFGAKPDGTGFTATLRASGAVGLTVADPSGLAIVADMEDDRRVALTTSEDAWILASRSSILPTLASPVLLGDRGDMRYENLWEGQPLGGDVLHDVTWDNSANPQFTYLEKAGPYNSSDEPPGSDTQSLVLDVDFPAATTDAWAAVSTALSGVDAGSTQRFELRLRGFEVNGPPGVTLQVFVEALNKMNEDINANGILDGESSAAQPGYAITPSAGRSTVLGTNRRGEANGRRDSEDRNSNGALDVADTGVVVAPSSGPSYIAEVPAGTTDWESVALDVADLVKANPTVFRDLRGIRITVKPSSTAAEVSGRLLIGGLWFSGSSMTSSSAALSVREVSPIDDSDLAAHTFSAAFPSLYGSLHGSAAWREDHGIADQSLSCSVVVDLTENQEASIERTLAPPADLSAYRLLRVYLLFPPGLALPADSWVTAGLESGSESLSVEIPATIFGEGWNEVSLLLQEPWTVEVNGAEAGSLVGSTGAVRRASALSVGLRAGPSGIASGFRFFTDEWHLAEARTAVDAAGLAEIEVGWRGAAFSLGALPIVSDAFVTAGVEHRDGSFLGPFGHRENRWRAGIAGTLLGALDTSFEAGGSVDVPSSVDPGVAPALLEGSTDRWAMGLELDAGVPWLPILEHLWERSISAERVPSVAPGGLQVAGYDHDRESLIVAERLGNEEEGPAQSLSFARTWTRDSRDLRAASDGTLVQEVGEDGLVEAGKGSLGWRWAGGELEVFAGRDRLFAAPPGPQPPDGPLSYAGRLASLFAPVEVALPGAAERSLRDRLALSLELPRTRYIGAHLGWESTYAELNVDPVSGSRDVATRDSFSLGLTASPDGAGRLVLAPLASLCFTGSYRAAAPGLDEATLLFAPWPAILAVPLGYLWPDGWGRTQEHAAVDAFSETAGLGNASNLVVTSFQLGARLASEPWYLPGRATVSVRGETGRDGDARSQKRTVSFSMGKDAAVGQANAGIDAGASFTADYGTKSRAASLSGSSSLRLPNLGGGELDLDANASWTGDRQSIADPALTLFPGVADDPDIVIAPRPDKDTLRAAVTLAWVWTRAGNPGRTSAAGAAARAGVGAAAVQETTNRERLRVESIVTWTNPGVPTSSVPLRATFEHSTELAVSDSLSLCLTGKAAAGVERRTGNGAEVLIPAVGFELGLTGRLRF